jgi:hypothetical protein
MSVPILKRARQRPQIIRDAGFFTLEVIKDELAVEDRIDAMIERAIKRRVQTKAMKQMLGTTSASAESDQPKKLLSNKLDESAKIVIKKQNGRRAGGAREAAAMRTLESNRRNSKPHESMCAQARPRTALLQTRSGPEKHVSRPLHPLPALMRRRSSASRSESESLNRRVELLCSRGQSGCGHRRDFSAAVSDWG